MGNRARSISLLFLTSVFVLFCTVAVAYAESSLLTPEENLWLSSRNNTIVVYPEKNDPPFSYQSPAGITQGLSIDYLELVADNIGAKIHYATPRSRAQILSDIKEGKGDVVLSLTPTTERETAFVFTESFIKVPVVIVVRKDAEVKKHVTMNDYVGKRIALVEGSAAEEFVRKNYPRVVVETVTDDEVGLQQTVLGEVDAVLMDAASLSFLLSKQVLSSVKIAGTLGLDYEPTFAVPKGKEILQTILEKGLSQVSTQDREMLTEKWILIPGEVKETQSFFERAQKNAGVVLMYGILLLGIIAIILLAFRRRTFVSKYFKKRHVVAQLEDKMEELEDTSKMLEEELKEVKEMEHSIAEKIEDLKG